MGVSYYELYSYILGTLYVPMLIKWGILPEFLWNIRKFKEGLKGKKSRLMEHQQTVDRPQNGTPACWATVWCASTNYYHRFR